MEWHGIISMAAGAKSPEGDKGMKQGTTIQERLKDLRVERHLKLDDVAAATGISKSALGNYENDDYKEINHGSIITLAKFYGVSTDYLLCLTENRSHSDTELSELHLSDDMVELLKSERINNRLLCEIATHENFIRLMADAEIYVDGIATKRFRDLNESLEMERANIISQYQPEIADKILQALEAAEIQEEDFFCHITHKEWDAILHDIRKDHEQDIESEPDISTTQKIISDIKKAMFNPSDYLELYCRVMCYQLEINYSRLSEEERKIFQQIMKKSAPFKNSPLTSRKKK